METNPTTENTKEQQFEGDRHYIEGQPSSKLKLLIGNSDDGDVDGDRYICGGDGDLYFLGGKWRMKRDSEGNVIEACKIITNPPIYAKNATLNKERTLHKK